MFTSNSAKSQKNEKQFVKSLTVAAWIYGNEWHRPLWKFEFRFLFRQFHIDCLVWKSNLISMSIWLLNPLQACCGASKLINSTHDIDLGRQELTRLVWVKHY